MSIWRQLSRGLRALTNRRVANQDIADEVERYLQQLRKSWRLLGCPQVRHAGPYG